jgi:hypothetical protein
MLITGCKLAKKKSAAGILVGYARIRLNSQVHLQKSVLKIKPAFAIWLGIGLV